MVVFLLCVEAALDNVKEIRLWPLEDTRAYLTVKDSTGDTEKKIVIDASEEMLIPGSRGSANVVMKIDNKHTWLKVVENTKAYGVRNITEDDDCKAVPMIAIEGRGVEILEWAPANPLSVVSGAGNTMEADVNDTDWAGFDIDANAPISLLDIKYTVITAKNL
eukprot:GHVO01023788.1.p2 GENE.GHVO01023788.1~~GHVO01023788.1.p2  ORF type:complete len:163 (+),score=27.97 GHVO01023788.1:14-502(+)